MNEDNVCIQEIKRKGAKQESAAQTRVTNARHRGDFLVYNLMTESGQSFLVMNTKLVVSGIEKQAN